MTFFKHPCGTPTRLLALLLCLLLLALPLCACKDEDKSDAGDTGDSPSTENKNDTSPEEEEEPKTDYNYHDGNLLADGTYEKIPHTLDNAGKCSCGVAFSMDLKYEKNEDGLSYSVAGRGTCAAREIAIPASYNGHPVTHIKKEAFKHDGFLTYVFLGKNIVEIGESAFSYCDELATVEAAADSTLSVIGVSAFAHSNWDPAYPEHGLSIGEWARKRFLFEIPPSVTRICDRAFYNIKAADIVLPTNGALREIGESAFATVATINASLVCRLYSDTGFHPTASTGLREQGPLILPKNLAVLGSRAFQNAKFHTLYAYTDTDGSLAFSNFYVPVKFYITCPLDRIGEEVFLGSHVSKVILSMNIKEIASGAFRGCNSLSEVSYVEGCEPTVVAEDAYSPNASNKLPSITLIPRPVSD